MASRAGLRRLGSSDGMTDGGFSRPFWGRYSSSSRIWRKQSCSEPATKWQTPERTLCVSAPPSDSKSQDSPVALRTTSGPVMNMWLVPSTMKTKSVKAGEYTAPPAQGPRMAEICGMKPEAWTFL